MDAIGAAIFLCLIGPAFVVVVLNRMGIMLAGYLRVDSKVYNSMWPTLVENDLLRLRPLFGKKKFVRNEIIVMKTPIINGMRLTDARYYVKRVIGLPGERIEVQPGVGVLVNGMQLREQLYVTNQAEYELRVLSDIGGMCQYGQQLRPYYGTPQANDPIVVPEHHYLVLGDNRNFSVDSHTFGFVHTNQIVSRVKSIAHRDLNAKAVAWVCAFCKKNQDQVKYLMQGLGAFICTDCLKELNSSDPKIPDETARCVLCLKWCDAEKIKCEPKMIVRACVDCLAIAEDECRKQETADKESSPAT